MTCTWKAERCTKVLHRGNKTGLCLKHSMEQQALDRTKTRICKDCETNPITRHSKNGRCQTCEYNRRTIGSWLNKNERQIENVGESLDFIKAKIKADVGASLDDLVRQARKAWPTFVKRPVVPAGDNKLMLEVQIVDAHFGKLAWAEETGESNYDTRIADELYRDAVSTILQRVSGYKFGRIVATAGSDGLHSDTKQGTTTKGTLLDTDSRYQRNFRALQRANVWAAQQYASVAPLVDLYPIPGNHDELSSWHLGNVLATFFHGQKGINVHLTPNHRQYCEHGKVMLMFTHGNQGKLERYPNLMAEDEPEMWGRTKFREAHTGDKHQTKVQEIMGTRVRICPALCPADAWHANNHFVHAKRAAEAFIWHADEGLIGTVIYNAPTRK